MTKSLEVPHSAESWASSIGSVLADPPGWITWLSLATAVLALGWRIVDDIRRRSDRKDDTKRQTNEFWYRQIVVPHFMTPLLDGLTARARELERLQKELPRMTAAERGLNYNGFFQEFKQLASKLTYDFMLIAVMDQKAYDNTRTIIEKIEDAVALHCQERCDPNFDAARGAQGRYADAPSFIRTQLNEILKTLIRLHHELNIQST